MKAKVAEEKPKKARKTKAKAEPEAPKTEEKPKRTRKAKVQPTEPAEAKPAKSKTSAKGKSGTTPQERQQYTEQVSAQSASRKEKHEKFLKKAKEKFPTPPPHPEEVAALSWYTDDGYKDMNKVLRGVADADVDQKAAKADIKMAVAAMEKMPKFEGTVVRGLNLDDATPEQIDAVVNQYKTGKVITEKAFLSTATGGVTPAYSGTAVLYTIKSKNGRSVKDVSAYPWEDEVLFPPGAKFKVLKKEFNSEENQHMIYMEEV